LGVGLGRFLNVFKYSKARRYFQIRPPYVYFAAALTWQQPKCNLITMKRGPKATRAKERARRARELLSNCDSAKIPKGVGLVSFRDLTPKERAYGKALGARARELLRTTQKRTAISG
jgi:hypothetical protein